MVEAAAPKTLPLSIRETKAALAVHLITVLQWAQQAQGDTVPNPVKQALLDSMARSFELVETLPEPEGKKH